MSDATTLTNALLRFDGRILVIAKEAEAMETIFAAARRQLALMPCGICNGSGMVMTYTEGPYGREDELAQPDADTCSVCGGLRYPPETIETVAKAIWEADDTTMRPTWDEEYDTIQDFYRGLAVAVLDALWKETP